MGGKDEFKTYVVERVTFASGDNNCQCIMNLVGKIGMEAFLRATCLPISKESYPDFAMKPHYRESDKKLVIGSPFSSDHLGRTNFMIWGIGSSAATLREAYGNFRELTYLDLSEVGLISPPQEVLALKLYGEWENKFNGVDIGYDNSNQAHVFPGITIKEGDIVNFELC